MFVEIQGPCLENKLNKTSITCKFFLLVLFLEVAPHCDEDDSGSATALFTYLEMKVRIKFIYSFIFCINIRPRSRDHVLEENMQVIKCFLFAVILAAVVLCDEDGNRHRSYLGGFRAYYGKYCQCNLIGR